MGKFRRFIIQESTPVKLDDVNKTVGTIPAVAFVGRFQPPTAAHAKIIKQMQSYSAAKPLLFIVRGEKSGQDKTKNPFSEKTQKDMIEKSTGVKNVIFVPSAFIGELVHQARNRKQEIVRLFCGTDRVKGYQSQIDRYKDELNLDMKIEEIKRSEEDISATKVRQAIITNDFDTFKKMTTNLDKKDFERLQKEIK